VLRRRSSRRRETAGSYDLAAATPDALLVAADDAAGAVRAAARALLTASEALLGSKQASRAAWAPLVGFDSATRLRLWLESVVAQAAFPDTFGTHMYLLPGCSCFAGAYLRACRMAVPTAGQNASSVVS
jgi:hypothetical protein